MPAYRWLGFVSLQISSLARFYKTEIRVASGPLSHSATTAAGNIRCVFDKNKRGNTYMAAHK